MTTETDGEMLRPALMAHAAEVAARGYRRERDLPGAVAGLMAGSERRILPTLAREEAALEAERRAKTAGYRVGRHLQVLAAYLAECREAGIAPAAAAFAPEAGAQAKASGSASLRRSTKSRRPSSSPGSMAGR